MITRIRNFIRIENSEAGYSLVGISLFMVVLGILLAGGIGLKQKYDWAARQEVTTANMTVVKEALARYQALNGRLPCPASLTEPPSSANFGKETVCADPVVTGTFEDAGRNGDPIRYGAVPVHTLNLPETALVDGWGHRYVYAVTKYYTGLSTAIDPLADRGAIFIKDRAGADITSTPGNVIYTVLSSGADERGAYTMAGVKIDNCAGTNCIETSNDGTLEASMNRQFNTQTDGGDANFTATMTYTSSNASYEWYTEDTWSACSCVAGAKQTRTFTTICRERSSHNPAPGMCAVSEKPVEERDCAAFCWDITYPDCPAVTSCSQAPSSVTGTPICEENTTKLVPDSLCDVSEKPTDLAKNCPGGGGCGGGGGGGGSSSGGGGYADMDGDGLGDTWVGDGCSGSTSCSDNRNQTVSVGGGTSGSNDGGGSSAAGSAGSGGTMSVICTHFYRRGRMSCALWRADLEFSKTNLFPCTLRGYHFWGIPAVKLMRKYPWMEIFFEWIAINRAEQIGYLVGIREKPNYLGVAIRIVIEPLCFVIGIFVPQQDWQKVHADMAAIRVR